MVAETFVKIEDIIKKGDLELGSLTINEVIEVAEKANVRVSDVVVYEAMKVNELSFQEVLDKVLDAFNHNIKALEIGLTDGESYLLGKVGAQIQQLKEKQTMLFDDEFLNNAVHYTLASQVGNHEIGLQPCAGTGDSTGYTGLVRAMLETGKPKELVARAAAVMLKIGTIFRVGKTTTGCNMEGFGAGAAATAAALVEFYEGTPRQLSRAVSLAISPTIGVPCVPRISVPGLCATHIAGAIVIGSLSAKLALLTDMPAVEDPDSMIAMAAAVHPLSAKYLVATTIDYMRPYFKTKPEVEKLIEEDIKQGEQEHCDRMKVRVKQEMRNLASKANSIIKPFGIAVVGGSSQAVGSPTNMGRIAHELMKGKIKKITIELYPELFSRRGANVPGVLMGAVFGASTSDSEAYKTVMDKVEQMDIEIEIKKTDTPQAQRIKIETTEGTYWVDSRNRGGARIHLVDASPSLEDAVKAAEKLGIEVV